MAEFEHDINRATTTVGTCHGMSLHVTGDCAVGSCHGMTPPDGLLHTHGLVANEIQVPSMLGKYDKQRELLHQFPFNLNLLV